MRLDEMWGGVAGGMGAGAGAGPAHANLPVIQSQVQTLVDMGFTRYDISF